MALAQLTDKIEPMYIIPKDWPEPHDDFMCHLFFGCYQIWPPGGQKTVFLALAQLTDKINPMYIIPKDQPDPHDDACVICFQFWPSGAQ